MVLASCQPLTFMLKPLTSPAEGAGNDSVSSCVEEEVVVEMKEGAMEKVELIAFRCTETRQSRG